MCPASLVLLSLVVLTDNNPELVADAAGSQPVGCEKYGRPGTARRHYSAADSLFKAGSKDGAASVLKHILRCTKPGTRIHEKAFAFLNDKLGKAATERVVDAETTPPAREARADRETKEDWAQRHYLVGNRLILQKKFNEAVRRFKLALKTDRGYADAHRGLGISYARLGEPELAAKHYRLYIKKRPYAQDADKVREILEIYERGRAEERGR